MLTLENTYQVELHPITSLETDDSQGGQSGHCASKKNCETDQDQIIDSNYPWTVKELASNHAAQGHHS